MMTQFYHQRVQTNYILHLFFISSLLCSHYIADLMKKLELHSMIVSVLLEIKFGHAQISVPKIGLPMSKAACINPCKFLFFHQMNFSELVL